MKQVAKLAQAIAHGPKLLFLDEPTNGLDPPARPRMIQLIQEIRDRGDLHLIVSSHLLRDVEECCDEVLILKDGRIAAFCNLEEERRANRRFLELETRGAQRNVHRRHRTPGLRGRPVPQGPHQTGACPMAWKCASLYELAAAQNVQIRRLNHRRDSLEDIFLKAMEAARWPFISRPTGLRGRAHARLVALPGDSALRLRRDAPQALLQHLLLCQFPLSASICALIIYIQHNASALKPAATSRRRRSDLHQRASSSISCGWQSMMALFLAAFVGPGQISPDLANNALSLYLARPFSRAEYVLGKMSVLLILISLMTWVPGLLLFILQATWKAGLVRPEPARSPTAIFFGAWIWILLLSLLALALSAWVKWKPRPAACMFGVFFVAAGVRRARSTACMRTNWGNLFNISHLVGSVWVSLFEGSPCTQPMARSSSASRAAKTLPLWMQLGLAAGRAAR